MILIILGAVLFFALLALAAGLAYQIAAQQGRLLLRLDAADESLGQAGAPPALAVGLMGDVPISAQNGTVPWRLPPNVLFAAELDSLPRGSVAPGFWLPRLDGGELSLEEYRGRRVLLVFSDPACGPCDALAPELERIHRRSPDLRILMISRGGVEANRRKVAQYGLTFPIALQRYREVSWTYGLLATPMGYLIDEYGIIASEVAVGKDAILALAGASARPAPRRGLLHRPGFRTVRPRRDLLRRPGSPPANLVEQPLVSVILATRDRPRLLSVALRCYRQQTYPRRELVVVDDGAAFPADAEAVAAAGGRIIRVDEGTPLGTKLNRGIGEARGPLCQKFDDDDWYAPAFLETMVSGLLNSLTVACRPTIMFLAPFLVFDVARWEVWRSEPQSISGATLLFAREDWEERPFRDIPHTEDIQFVIEQATIGASLLSVQALDLYLAVRHGGRAGERRHIWAQQWIGKSFEEHPQERPLHDRQPEALLPDWALGFYRELSRHPVPTDSHS